MSHDPAAPHSSQTTSMPSSEVASSPAKTPSRSPAAAAAGGSVVTVNCHCSDSEGDRERGNNTNDEPDPDLYPGLVNGIEVGGEDEDDAEKDSGNGSVGEFVPSSDLQITLTLPR